MKIIPQDLVTETYEEVAQFNEKQARAEMTRVSKTQPNLVGFLLEFTQDSAPDVAELGVYCLFTVFRMFQKSARKPIQQVTHEMIVECYEANEALLESLEKTHDRFIERIASIQLSDQPYVMKYVVEALFEDGQEDEDSALTEEDIGYLFLLLKTAVEALNKTIKE